MASSNIIQIGKTCAINYKTSSGRELGGKKTRKNKSNAAKPNPMQSKPNQNDIIFAKMHLYFQTLEFWKRLNDEG